MIQKPTWRDRNSLGLDRSWETAKNKTFLERISDGIDGILNQKIDVSQYDIYVPWVKIKNFVKLVPLEHKDAYIEQKKRNVLDFLGSLSLKRKVEPKVDNTSATGEKWESESWKEYFHNLSIDPAFIDLRDYYRLGYINDDEIRISVQACLIKKSKAIVKILLNKSPFQPNVSHDSSDTQMAVFAWALTNELVKSEDTGDIEFDEDSAESLIGKYGDYVEDDIFDVIIKELKPKKETQGQISPEDSALLFE